MAAPTTDPEIGARFGRLVVTSKAIKIKSHRHFTAVCDCGVIKTYEKQNLIKRTVSCGCYLKELVGTQSKTHGKSKSPIYAVWNMMKQRCNVPTNIFYAEYGGRGIKVSEEWMDFENFYRDMGDCPYKGATLERRDNNANYCKENVYWASRVEQANNKRNSVRFEFRGEQLSLRQIADKVGMNPKSLSSRIYGQGMTVEDAVSLPILTPAECTVVKRKQPGYRGRVEGRKLYQDNKVNV